MGGQGGPGPALSTRFNGAKRVRPLANTTSSNSFPAQPFEEGP